MSPIVNRGMPDDPAPFPPGHPIASYGIEIAHAHHCRPTDDYPCTCGIGPYTPMPLSAPFDLDTPVHSLVPAAERDAARQLLDEWERTKFALDHPETQAWILEVLGYYAGHYRHPGLREPECWSPLHLRYLPDVVPWGTQNTIDSHVGVHFIRRFYPAFHPTKAQFLAARYTRPPGSEASC